MLFPHLGKWGMDVPVLWKGRMGTGGGNRLDAIFIFQRT